MNTPVADLLVTHARPWSDGALVPGADALAIASGRVVALGRASELEAFAGTRTRRIDARGATVTPGLCDAHLHLVQWARAADEISLHAAGSPAEVARAVDGALRARPDAPVLVGRGWDANAWADAPHRHALDAVSGDRPVVLHSHDFHALWVNGAALRAAGISRDTPDPEGGRFERDAAGEPSGVVREHATRAFTALEARSRDGSDLERVRRAAQRLHAEGITAVHDFEGPGAAAVLREAIERDGAWVRVLMHLAHEELDAALGAGWTSGTGDDRFRGGAVKLFADGTLGSRTAAMLAPYQGTDERGMDLIAPDALRVLVRRALEGGIAVAIHAIGDRAVRASLDAFEAAAPLLGRPALPSRIEHAQLVDPADLPRFATLGVAASMQPSHCVSDIGLALRWWGARTRTAYPWRALCDAGTLMAFGSDAPVEPPSAALGLHAALTRTRRDGTPAGGFVPEQRVTLDQALTAYTAGPARLAGTWPRLGRLAPGTAADLVVWNADLHRLDPAALADAAPVATVLDGRVVFEAAPVTRESREAHA